MQVAEAAKVVQETIVKHHLSIASGSIGARRLWLVELCSLAVSIGPAQAFACEMLKIINMFHLHIL